MTIETVLGCLPILCFVLMILWAIWQSLRVD